MKIDFTQVLKTLDGTEMKVPGDKVFTLAMATTEALLASYEDEKSLSGEEKASRYTLALAIHASVEPLDLKVEDVALIKKLVAKGYGPLIVGQAWMLLDPQ